MNDTSPLPDRLTLSRLMVLMAGVGVSLALFVPRDFKAWPPEVEQYRALASTVLIGFSLPGVIYNLPAKRQRQGVGSLLWLALSLGAWMLTPPAIAQPSGSATAMACMYYLLPLMSLWVLLAGSLGRGVRWRHLSRTAPWRERFGVYLGLAWSVLGLWLLGDLYWDAFMK